jgi:hypothetical protein
LIDGDGTWEFAYGERDDATPEKLKAALRPLKAFRTRQGADFVIEPSVADRLEELRSVIQAESISYGEIAELQSLASFIPEGDVELLQWAGVEEFPEGDEDEAEPLPQAELDAKALDALTLILREDPWPSGADFLDWCNEIVSATGRDTSEPLPEGEDD